MGGREWAGSDGGRRQEYDLPSQYFIPMEAMEAVVMLDSVVGHLGGGIAEENHFLSCLYSS